MKPYLGILLMAGIFIAAALFSLEKERSYNKSQAEKFQKKYDSLSTKLTESKRRQDILLHRLDSISLHNHSLSTNVDSLQQAIDNYRNPYTEKSESELGDLMNQRANGHL